MDHRRSEAKQSSLVNVVSYFERRYFSLLDANGVPMSAGVVRGELS